MLALSRQNASITLEVHVNDWFYERQNNVRATLDEFVVEISKSLKTMNVVHWIWCASHQDHIPKDISKPYTPITLHDYSGNYISCVCHEGLIIPVTILGLDEHPYHAHLRSLSRSICHLDAKLWWRCLLSIIKCHFPYVGKLLVHLWN